MKRKLLLIIGAVAVWALVQPVGAQSVAVRDDANGYLCFDFRAWGQCFAYTPTPDMAETASPAPSRTPSPSPTATPTALPRPTNTPTATPTAVKASIVNGGFENGLTGWAVYRITGSFEINSENLSRGASEYAIYSGDGSARLLGHWACWKGGLYQVVSAPAGTHVKVAARFKLFGSPQDGMVSADKNMNWYAGIGLDPKGLEQPTSSRVEWQIINETGGLTDDIGGGMRALWMPIAAETITESNRLTVFLMADLGKAGEGACIWGQWNLLAFFDDVSIEILP